MYPHKKVRHRNSVIPTPSSGYSQKHLGLSRKKELFREQEINIIKLTCQSVVKLNTTSGLSQQSGIFGKVFIA